MKKSILGLEGVKVLSRNVQKNVNGGTGADTSVGDVRFNRNCTWTIVEGGQTYKWPFYSNAGNGPWVSSAANAECVSNIQAGASRCSYDCAYDGQG